MDKKSAITFIKLRRVRTGLDTFSLSFLFSELNQFCKQLNLTSRWALLKGILLSFFFFLNLVGPIKKPHRERVNYYVNVQILHRICSDPVILTCLLISWRMIQSRHTLEELANFFPILRIHYGFELERGCTRGKRFTLSACWFALSSFIDEKGFETMTPKLYPSGTLSVIGRQPMKLYRHWL